MSASAAPSRLMKHARAAASARRWHWAWRRLHALARCKPVEDSIFSTRHEWAVDAGYCLDRYTVDNPNEEPQ